MKVTYKLARYTWLSSEQAPAGRGPGWGIRTLEGFGSAFERSCEPFLTGMRAPEDGSTVIKFFYAKPFDRQVYLSVRKLPPLPEMGGGNNNKLVTLYVPDCADTGKLLACPPDFEEPDGLEMTAEGPERLPFEALLGKYGLKREEVDAQGAGGREEAGREEKRLAVFLGYLYLYFTSDTWKHVIYHAPGGNSLEKALEITALFCQCIPEEFGGKTKAQMEKEIVMTAGDEPSGYGLVFPTGQSENGNAFQQSADYVEAHSFSFTKAYEPEQQLSRACMDRKVDHSSSFFLALANEMTESPEAGAGMVREISQLGGSSMEIASLAAAYTSLYLPGKAELEREKSLRKLMETCSTPEELSEILKLEHVDFQSALAHYQRNARKNAADIYLEGGLEILRLLYDAMADARLARRMMDEYEDLDRYPDMFSGVNDTDRAHIHEILKQYREILFPAIMTDREKGDVTPKTEADFTQSEVTFCEKNDKIEAESENMAQRDAKAKAAAAETARHDAASANTSHTDTAERMNEVLQNKKGGLFSSLLGRKNGGKQ